MKERTTRVVGVTLSILLILVIGLVAGTAFSGHEDDIEDGHRNHELELIEAGFTEEQAELILGMMSEDGHGHTDGGFLSESWYILTDPAHWIAEFAAELVFFFAIHMWIMEKIVHRHRVSRRGNMLHFDGPDAS